MLRGVGANQTVDQTNLFGAAVRWSFDVGVPEARGDSVRYWRSLVSRAVATSVGASGGAAGPVHVNVPLREPLTATSDGVGFNFPLDGRHDAAARSAHGAVGVKFLGGDFKTLFEICSRRHNRCHSEKRSDEESFRKDPSRSFGMTT